MAAQALGFVERLKKIRVAGVEVDEYNWKDDPQSKIRSLQRVLKGQVFTNSYDKIEFRVFPIITRSFRQLQKLSFDTLLFTNRNIGEKQLPQSLVL